MFKKLLIIAILSCSILNVNAASAGRLLFRAFTAASVVGMGSAGYILTQVAEEAEQVKPELIVENVLHSSLGRNCLYATAAVSGLFALYTYLASPKIYPYHIFYRLKVVNGPSCAGLRKKKFSSIPLSIDEGAQCTLEICKIPAGGQLPEYLLSFTGGDVLFSGNVSFNKRNIINKINSYFI